VATNGFGFACEEMIRDLLPQIGIPHKYNRGEGMDWFWWGSPREDRCLGIDCWITLGLQEFAVDFTVISGEQGMREKSTKAIERGVIPVFVPQKILRDALEGNEYCLAQLSTEIKSQIKLKLGLLNGNRMTREKAALIKEAMCPKILVPITR